MQAKPSTWLNGISGNRPLWGMKLHETKCLGFLSSSKWNYLSIKVHTWVWTKFLPEHIPCNSDVKPPTLEHCVMMANNSLPCLGLYGTICSPLASELIQWLLLRPLSKILDSTLIGSIRTGWLAESDERFRERNSETFAFFFSWCTHVVTVSRLNPSLWYSRSEGYANCNYSPALTVGGERH